MNYLLRDFDEGFWHKVKTKALRSKKPIRTVILRLLLQWINDEIELEKL